VDVKRAAEALRISSEGVRQRIRRGSLEAEKGDDGRVYVWLDTEEESYERGADAVINRLEDEVAFLRRELATREEELRRRDAIMMSMTERLKALESPPGPRESSMRASEEPGSDSSAPREESGPMSRPWYRRWWGL
jgi:hypothetical protein